jgi:hypothetical protein
VLDQKKQNTNKTKKEKEKKTKQDKTKLPALSSEFSQPRRSRR